MYEYYTRLYLTEYLMYNSVEPHAWKYVALQCNTKSVNNSLKTLICCKHRCIDLHRRMTHHISKQAVQAGHSQDNFLILITVRLTRVSQNEEFA